MKLWRLSDPCKYEYAQASRRGSWEGSPSRRVRPLIIEWEPASDVVGDFTWPGFDSRTSSSRTLSPRYCTRPTCPASKLGPVQMQENSEPAKRRSKKPKVQLPYSGPQLWDLWVTACTRVNRDRSTIKELRREDDAVDFEVLGVQHEERTWDQQRMQLVKKMHPRAEGQGLFVPSIKGVFRVEECPAWIFCTDDVRQLIQEHGFTNVLFLERGTCLPRKQRL